ncbi:hypothetical protein CC86DRAFT_382282 [Ophiobolus disseminans]|uniref:Uncharacterized protein n=1 Tax=Ophiobolus disseminans TaxID=1469910 RepID=A0A6A6ZYR8_9PLEO|nr:hypothetical protein CC86DRAFT_382282 [Ophiobolus disseminans]
MVTVTSTEITTLTESTKLTDTETVVPTLDPSTVTQTASQAPITSTATITTTKTEKVTATSTIVIDPSRRGVDLFFPPNFPKWISVLFWLPWLCSLAWGIYSYNAIRRLQRKIGRERGQGWRAALTKRCENAEE